MAKGGMGKRKGAGFERKVCDGLSRWIDPDTEETLFWRSAMSGGRATVRSRFGKKDSSQVGDITCVASKGEWFTNFFVIECKFLRSLDLQAAFIENKGKLAKHWKTLIAIAAQHNKQPLMIAKENRTDILLITSLKGWQKLITLVKPLVTWHRTPDRVYIFKFKQLLEQPYEYSLDLRSSSRLKSTKRRSVEPVPVAEETNKSSKDKTAVDTRGHHKRERPTRRKSRQ